MHGLQLKIPSDSTSFYHLPEQTRVLMHVFLWNGGSSHVKIEVPSGKLGVCFWFVGKHRCFKSGLPQEVSVAIGGELGD